MQPGHGTGACSRAVKPCQRPQLQAQHAVAACSIILEASAMAGRAAWLYRGAFLICWCCGRAFFKAPAAVITFRKFNVLSSRLQVAFLLQSPILAV